MSEMLALLHKRRSVVVRDMVGPGPVGEEIDALLAAGARVPDHGKLAPWRFMVFEGGARAAFGDVLAAAFRANEPTADDERADFERGRFERAPLVIGVISRIAKDSKIPEWEQTLSAGAVCQNILVAASALGFASQWLTEWYAYDAHVITALGLGADERVAGFLYFGSMDEPPKERPRPLLADITERWISPKSIS